MVAVPNHRSTIDNSDILCISMLSKYCHHFSIYGNFGIFLSQNNCIDIKELYCFANNSKSKFQQFPQWVTVVTCNTSLEPVT